MRPPARAGGFLLASLAVGCVGAARDDVAQARARYERCVAAASEAECAPERERVLAAERAYQAEAQRAWGCNPAQPDCPQKR
ncbi:MAG TPA: hypothetical protein VFT98_18550 [Myxococcota bacterium]|nr:hypothetical protein [Myxococcota bacterium]